MTPAPSTSEPASQGKLAELETPPAPRLLDIDWSTITLTSDADALALWRRIAPTGEDWEGKLEEIPDDGSIASSLAVTLLNGGNFTCATPQPPRDCPARVADIDAPAANTTFDDPCLRRMLALWSLASLDDADLPRAYDAMKAIAAIPPPESQLVASVLGVLPETEQDKRLELRAIAMRAGHRELVNGSLGDLDDAHLVEAVKLGIDGALDALTAETHRAVFIAAINDPKLHASARIGAINELLGETDGALPRDLKTALATATKAADCSVAASAARALVQRGQRTFAPSRPRTRTTAPMMRALCVLASFESLQGADEPSYLLGYVPTKGLELVTVTYDAYSDRDTDGDGDPHTERSLTTVPRNELVLPEIEDMIRAFTSCDGTTCKSPDREFRFGFKPGPGGDLLLTRLEVVDRPWCPATR